MAEKKSEKKIELKDGEVAMTTKEVVELYNLINPAKLTKMSDSKAKFAIIKDNRALKKIADDYETFQKDALEKLKGADFDKWQEKAQKWQGKTAKTPDEQKEVASINDYFAKYQGEANKCLQDESDKVHAIKLEKVSEEEFLKFCDSNEDWNAGQMLTLYDKLVG